MFDTNGQWLPLETYDDFDNGLGELIDLWSSAEQGDTTERKQAALAHYKAGLEAATLQWAENKAKTKKYAAIALELAEFEAVLVNGAAPAA